MTQYYNTSTEYEINSLKYKTSKYFSVRVSRWSEVLEASPACPSDNTSMKTKISTQHWYNDTDTGGKREHSVGNLPHCHLHSPQIQRRVAWASNIPEHYNAAVRTSNIAKYTSSHPTPLCLCIMLVSYVLLGVVSCVRFKVFQPNSASISNLFNAPPPPPQQMSTQIPLNKITQHSDTIDNQCKLPGHR
jgi:hypothetical protein